jgi:hypothetical protein
MKTMPGAGFPSPADEPPYTGATDPALIASATSASRSWQALDFTTLWATFDVGSVSVSGRYMAGHWGATPVAENPCIVSVEELRLVGEMDGETVEVGTTPQRVYFRSADRSLSIPRSDQPLPDAYKQMLHTEGLCDGEARMDADDLLGALKLAMPIAGEELMNNYVEIHLAPNETCLNVRSSLGSGKILLHPVTEPGVEAKLRFSAKNLRSFLNGVDGEFTLRYHDGVTPVIAEGEGWKRVAVQKIKEGG